MVFCAREKVGRLGRDKEGNVFLHGTMIIEVGRLVMVIMLMMEDLQATRSRSIIKRYNEKNYQFSFRRDSIGDPKLLQNL